MKILEYTLGLPPLRRGGLPRYSTDLSSELSKNHQVYLLYPGQINPYSKKIKLSVKRNAYPFETIEMKNPLPVSLGLGIQDEDSYMDQRDISALKDLIKNLQPDVVHFHTIMGMPKEFFEYLHSNNIKTVYTTHDFYGLCPKMLVNDPKEALKTSKCSYDCMLCNVGPSYKKIVIMQSHLYAKLKNNKIIKKIRSKNKSGLTLENNEVSFSDEEIEKKYKLRKYYFEIFKLIDIFHFNSSVSKSYFQHYFPNIVGRVIPITHSDLQDNRNKSNTDVNKPIELGYIGPYDKKKGFYLYTQILEKIKVKNQFKANFYGDIAERDILKNKPFINHGILSQKNLNKEYKKLDLIVVPSLWHETFGYVVLEALLNGVPCLVSNNVGAKDLLPDSWIFDNENELNSILSDLINNPLKLQYMKEQIKQLNLQYKMSEHVKRIIRDVYI